MTQNNTGKFNFTGFGLVGLLALIVLGGGALLLNQNSPTFSVEGGKVGDVKGGEGGKGGDSSTTNIYGSGTNQKGDGVEIGRPLQVFPLAVPDVQDFQASGSWSLARTPPPSDN